MVIEKTADMRRRCQWFVVRIVWGYSSSYLFWADTVGAYTRGLLPIPILLWYTVANLSLNYLNTMWFFKIVKGAVKALKPRAGQLAKTD